MSINQEIKKQILEYIKQPIPQNAAMPIVEKSIPVPFFGDIEKARIVTISLNPSNLEFENKWGLLSKSKKRFVDRDLLGVEDSSTLDETQANQVYDSLKNYFHNSNAYTDWFDKLEEFAGKIFHSSYYDGSMVNMDIYPWATQQKWKDLRSKDKNRALREYSLLKNILLNKDCCFDYVFLNGKGVKKYLETLGIKIKEELVTGTKTQSNHQRFIYHQTLENKVKLIGFSCYIQNSYESNDYLSEVRDILVQRL